MKRKHTYFLIFLVFVAFFLRIYLLSQNLFFGPEQGTDFLIIRDIVYQHHFTLIGPKTDISGIFHGPFYYYLAAIPLFLSMGNVLDVVGFFLILQAFTVVLFYLLGKELSNRRIGVLAAVLYTVSFSAITTARWLSNPPLSISLFCLFFLFFIRFLKGNNKSLFFAVVVEGLLGQVEFINFLYLGFFSIIVLIIFHKRFLTLSLAEKIIAVFLLFLTSAATYLLFDLRHRFLISQSILGLLTGKSGDHLSYIASLQQTISQFFTVFSDTIFPVSYAAGVIIACIATVIFVYTNLRKNQEARLLLLWLMLPLLLLITLRYSSLYQLFITFIPAMILITSEAIDVIEKKFHYIGMLCLFVLLLANLYAWWAYLPTNYHVFFQTTQPDLRYSDETAAIQWIYTQAHGSSFTYQAYTIPYWSPEGWQYLFWYYGTQRYHYVPEVNSQTTKKLFLIVQNDPDNKLYQLHWLKSMRQDGKQVPAAQQFDSLRISELVMK